MRSTRIGQAMALSTAIAAIISLPAFAQEQAGTSPSGNGNDSQDIVVTAQRTSSLASKTPIAITAVSGEALRAAGVTNPVALADQIPNVSIVRNLGMQITIRGVTSSDTTEKGDPSAAFLLDGIYIARPQAQEVSFYDIGRIEVLRGPQGTLYGRNTTAGVINIITNRPSHKYEAALNVSYGNYDTRQADAMVNTPVSDTLALRFAGSYDRRDNYIKSQPGEVYDQGPFKNNISARAQALFEPTQDLSLLVSADYSRLRGNAMVDVDGAKFFEALPVGAPDYATPATHTLDADEALNRDFALQGKPRTNNRTYGIMGELNWNFGPLTLTYLGSYRVFKQDEDVTGYFGFAYRTDTRATFKQNSQELRFSTNDDGPLKAQFGLYYFREEGKSVVDLPDFLGPNSFYGFNYDPILAKSYAGFAQITYSLADDWRITGGARYSKDKKSRFGYTTSQSDLSDPSTETVALNAASVESSKLTWRAGLEHDINSRTLSYATVSTGYKAGGFNDGCLENSVINGVACNVPRPADQLYYRPETLTAYEIGLKTRTYDNVLRVAASAFYYDYKNLQLSSFVEYLGAPAGLTLNAGKARVWGIELETTLNPSPRNRFDLSFTYLSAEYTKYRPLGEDSEPNFDGRPLDRSPKVVTTAAYTYTLPLNAGDTVALNVRTRLSSEYYLTYFSAGQQLRQPSFTRTDATLTYTSPDSRWTVQGFVRNIENAIQISAASFGTVDIVPTDPRTYGARIGLKF